MKSFLSKVKRNSVITKKYIFVITDIFLLFFSLVFFCEIYYLAPISTVLLCSTLISSFILILMFAFKINRSLWQFASASDFLIFMLSYALGFIFFCIVNTTILNLQISYVYLLAGLSLALFASIFIRLYIKRLLLNDVIFDKKKLTGNKKCVAIIGAGNAGVSLQNEILRNPNSQYITWGFFDDDPLKIGQQIGRAYVRGAIKDVLKLVPQSPVEEIIIAIPSLDIQRRKEIITLCNSIHKHVKIMPDTMLIMEKGRDFISSIRDVKVEDLLGRTSVKFSNQELDLFVKDKTVLVTGGSGSIGSELCRQIVGANIKKLVIFDICENDSYMLYRELHQTYGNHIHVAVEIGNIVDERRVNEVFTQYHPDIVFHAAAHKHVPLMEGCPDEAVQNNIFGTYNILTAARRYKCSKFVLISTDKAINPTNVMGATKRYCELMTRAMACMPDCKTDFVAVRFGNVLGSHGSVLPLFQMQLEQGGPITITDKRIIRYFMTIPEAAGLVIKAAAMAKKSEVFILDMGEPVKILDLAENFIRLSGYEPYSEIPIIETGLRPGEKLYEELLINDQNHKNTSISKIYVERNLESISIDEIKAGLALLQRAINKGDKKAVLDALRKLVPTFKTPEEVNEKFDAVEDQYQVALLPRKKGSYSQAKDLAYAFQK